MFDIGFFELLVIGVVLLLVMGPERLPEVARQGAFIIKRVRAWIFQMKSEMNLIDDPILKEFKQAKNELNEFQRDLHQAGSDLALSLDKGIDAPDDFPQELQESDLTTLEPTKQVTKSESSKKASVKPLVKKTAKKKTIKKASANNVSDKVATTKKKTSRKVTKKTPKRIAKKI